MCGLWHHRKFNLDGFVPPVDTAVENKLRTIRSRIMSKKKIKISVPHVTPFISGWKDGETKWRELSSREFFDKSCQILTGVNKTSRYQLNARKYICNPDQFNRHSDSYANEPFLSWHYRVIRNMYIVLHSRQLCIP